MSRRCLGSVSEVSRKCLGSVSEVLATCLPGERAARLSGTRRAARGQPSPAARLQGSLRPALGRGSSARCLSSPDGCPAAAAGRTDPSPSTPRHTRPPPASGRRGLPRDSPRAPPPKPRSQRHRHRRRHRYRRASHSRPGLLRPEGRPGRRRWGSERGGGRGSCSGGGGGGAVRGAPPQQPRASESPHPPEGGRALLAGLA